MRFLLCLLVLALACGDDAAPPPPTTDTGPRDLQVPDAGDGDADAGSEDADPMDMDIPSDGAAPTCSLAMDAILQLSEDRGTPGRRIALLESSEGALASWATEEVGQRDVAAQWIAIDGSASSRIPITNDFFTHQTPSLAQLGDTFRAVWVSNATGAFELESTDISGDPLRAGAASVLTDNMRVEATPALSSGTDGGVLAWTEDGDEGTRLLVQPMDRTGALTGSAVEVNGASAAPREPSIRAISAGTLLLTWQSGNQAWMRTLSDAGAPIDEAQRIDDGETVVGAPQIASGLFGTAIAYDVRVDDVRSEFRLRLLGADGTLLPPVPAPLEAGEQAVNVAIAPFAEGFIAAYRVLQSDELGGPAIRLLTLDAQGRAVQRLDLSSTTAAGGPCSIAVTNEGDVVAAWSELREDGATRFNAAPLDCAR